MMEKLEMLDMFCAIMWSAFLKAQGRHAANTDKLNIKMKSFTRNNALWLSVAILSFLMTSTLSAFGQVYTRPTNPSPTPKPMMQDIEVVQPNNNNPNPSSTTLVDKTASVKSVYPVLNAVDIPGYSGVLVETLDGKTVVDNYSNYAFNPASNVKILTAYAVLKTFGPDSRFQTTFWTDGQIDAANGTLNGNLYVSGYDPMFNLEHGVNVAYELNRLGVSNITGNLYVTPNFAMNYNGSATVAANTLANVMNASKRNSAAVTAWQNYLVNSGKFGKISVIPSVSIAGSVYVQALSSNLRQLFSHDSAPLKEIVKVTMCYSNNFLAERLGDMVGGPYRVAQIAQQGAGVLPQEISIQTASGLGINRVTPHSMMKVLRALRGELAKWNMNFTDIMPVAGVDKGTLEGRFDTDFARGSVVGKTGTLGRTDGGVSALAGEVSTRNGRLLFVIFNQRGSVPRFRTFQNSFVSLVQGQFGGASTMPYNAVSLDVRLANTRISYPERARVN